MNAKVGQFWRMKECSAWSSLQTYYVYEVFTENTTTYPYGKAKLERVGEPDPDYLHDWSEPLSVLEEHYNLITDKNEIGFLLLQKD